MTEQRRYDVDWTNEDNPQIVIAQPGDQDAMTLGEAQQVIGKAPTGGSITVDDSSSLRTFEIAPWSPEEAEHYNRTGETPLARLHRQNLEAQWSSADRDDEK